ncbi:hypothetical protein PK35_09170 [Tamlana nanhaiensis]|uniref:DUF3857 domain-containing protein n=1 Tax=Neotamlana nanhaiensis TaxID=1382798 RepID=A0A0D7W203_9FLAO|nr:DUF3857 domain-containing protein [Tamlana nanhaiensis]KJD33116.1 hypothetical protein PK35_09170 [Tamlana nanhaiensis]
MKKSYIFALFLTYSILSFSQAIEVEPSFRVSLKDLKMNSFEKDTTANAVVLYEYGKSYIEPHHYKLITEKKFKIKLLNKDGFKHASVNIHLYKKDNFMLEFVDDIVATTYNLENGEVVTTKLKKNQIFTEKYDDNHTIKKFTLPNIKEGSVISYSYKIESPFKFKYHPWYFQSDIPKVYSEYNTSIPANYRYHIKLIGGKKLAINENKLEKDCLRGGNGGVASCFVSRYAMKDMPAFIEESYMTTKYNYLSRIEYELETFSGFDGTKQDFTKSWKDVDKELRTDKNIGKQLRKSVKIEEILPQNIINEPDALKRAQAIYKFVQDNYTWNEEFAMFKDVSVKDLIKEKSSNATAINILLNILLEESGITSYPVLLSTRGNGFATKIFPVLTDFNYLIAKISIDGKDYLLDATDGYLTFGELPFRCLNQYARLLDFESESSWIDIQPASRSSKMYTVSLSFDENQNLTGTVKNRLTGYNAYFAKQDYFPNDEAYVEELTNNSPFIEISNHSVSTEQDSKMFSESYDIEYIQDETGENIYINPFVIKFFKENPFKLQERSYPIDLGFKRNYLYTTTLNINDNHTVKELPESVRLGLPNNTGEINFNVTQLGNVLSLTFKLSLNSEIYPAYYYPYLKEFMSKAVDIQKNSIIVLTSK